jgi:hypothetical protein
VAQYVRYPRFLLMKIKKYDYIDKSITEENFITMFRNILYKQELVTIRLQNVLQLLQVIETPMFAECSILT